TVQPQKKLLRDLAFKPLARYAMCVAIAPKHPLAKLKSVTLAQLANEPLIGYNRADYPDYHEHLESIFAPTGRVPRVAEEHDGIASIITAVESGRGFAFVPEPTVCLVGPRVKILPLKPEDRRICVGAIWVETSTSHLVNGFVEVAEGKQ